MVSYIVFDLTFGCYLLGSEFSLSKIQLKWCDTNYHFIHKSPKTPPIDIFVVFSSEYFRSHIHNSANPGARFDVRSEEFGKTKVNQFDVTIFLNHHVFSLQVSMDVTPAM